MHTTELCGDRVKTLIEQMTGEELAEFSGIIAAVIRSEDAGNRKLLAALLNDKARNT